MRGNRARIERLEKVLGELAYACTEDGQREAAEDADRRGTATLEQYRLLYGNSGRDDFLASIPALVACERLAEAAGVNGPIVYPPVVQYLPNQPWLAATYPPDEALPSELAANLREAVGSNRIAATHTITSAERARFRRDGGWDPVRGRRQAAAELFLYEDVEAMSWRESLWMPTSAGMWRLKPAVIEASQQEFETTETPGPHTEGLYSILALSLGRLGVSLGVPVWGPAVVTYSALVDAAIAFATDENGPPGWSDQVR